jgi:hypothetical protein
METVRIELGNGDYALVLKEMTHKTTKALQGLLRRTLGEDAFISLQGQLRTISDENKKKEILQKVTLEGDDEIILLNQIKEWSFGEVTAVVMDSISESKYTLLSVEVNKLYSSSPLPVKS